MGSLGEGYKKSYRQQPIVTISLALRLKPTGFVSLCWACSRIDPIADTLITEA
jgi:hypothetical protein